MKTVPARISLPGAAGELMPSSQDKVEWLKTQLRLERKRDFRSFASTRERAYGMEVLVERAISMLEDSVRPAAGTARHPVFAFLLGEGELDGFHFGDSDTARPRPRYGGANICGKP